MKGNSIGILAEVVMVEVMILIGTLIDSHPGAPMVTLGTMTMYMTSIQMKKIETIRGYPPVLVESQGVVLILSLQEKKVSTVGQEIIRDMWTNIPEMIMMGIEARIKIEKSHH